MMNDTALRKIDLNLLLAFSVLMEERNVSRAAERLLVGQPGLSAALRRLREALDDDLFVRVGRGLEPTQRALDIAPVIDQALGSIATALRPPAAFDPLTYAGEFRIGMCDNLETAFFGPLAARIRQEAPRARLVSVASDHRHINRQLDEGFFEMSISVHDEPVSWQVREPLFDQPSICIYSPRQLALRGALTLDDFTREAHVAVSFEGNSSGDIDAVLGRTGRTRSIIASVPRYSALPTALNAMPVIATIPESIARCMAKLHGLAISPPPIDLPSAPVSMLYRRIDRADQRARWFRDLFIEVAAKALEETGCHCTMGLAKAA
jgi:LysR family transcriptional regulator, mexEF-oprN operon transcriptional activator